MPVAEYFAQQATTIPFIPSSFIFPDTGLFCLPEEFLLIFLCGVTYKPGNSMDIRPRD